MASTISYAKIVRNQKDEQIEPSDEKCPEGQKTKCQDSLIKSQSPDIDDQSFKEVSSKTMNSMSKWRPVFWRLQRSSCDH